MMAKKPFFAAFAEGGGKGDRQREREREIVVVAFQSDSATRHDLLGATERLIFNCNQHSRLPPCSTVDKYSCTVDVISSFF